jgi:PmbA protein
VSTKHQEAATFALDCALKHGCEGVKVAATSGRGHRVVIEHDSLSLATSSDHQKIAISVHKDSKQGSSSTNSLEPEAIKKIVDEAVRLADFSVADEALTIPPKQEAAKVLEGIYDTTCAQMSLEELERFSALGMDIFSKYPKVALDRLELEVGESEQVMALSSGTLQTEKQTGLSWSYLALAKDGDDVSGMDYGGQSRFAKADAESKFLSGIERFCERVMGNLGAQKCPSYHGLVLLSPRAVTSLLTNTIFYHMSGRSIMDGKSKYIDKLNQSIASENLSIRDEPFDLELSGATTFDNDGLWTKPSVLIDKGILKTHIHDAYSAKRSGASINALAGAPFCMHIAGGKESLTSMRSARAELLEVFRFSGNVDPLTGDFSGVAKCSSLYQSGKRSGAVQETMIAGNAFDLLQKIQALSLEVETVGGSYKAPYMLVDAVSVS